MAATLAIPAVTETDLRQFQVQHFVAHQTPSQSFSGSSMHDTNLHDDDDDDDDDLLGYYPDGVKRTLTDEQVAIFRHSEVQSIIRARELQAEAEEDAVTNKNDQQSVSEELPSPMECDAIDADDASEPVDVPSDYEEWDVQLRKQQNAIKKSKKKKRKTGAAKPKGARSNDDPSIPKRKWDDYVEVSDTNPDALTHRRVAREMDDARTQSIELDY